MFYLIRSNYWWRDKSKTKTVMTPFNTIKLDIDMGKTLYVWFLMLVSVSGWTTVTPGQVRGSRVGPDMRCSCPEEWGWLRDPARAKLPSTATLQQYSSDQTFSLSLSVSVSASVSAPRFAIWYVTVMLPCLCDVKQTLLSLQEVTAVVSIVLLNIHYSLSQVSRWFKVTKLLARSLEIIRWIHLDCSGYWWW